MIKYFDFRFLSLACSWSGKAVIFFVLLSSCDFKPQDKVVPAWEMEVLGPLVKGDLTIQEIAELDSLHDGFSISLSELGVSNPGVPVIIPAFGPMNLGPYGLDLTDAFASAELESGDLYFTIRNELEVNIKSGTTFIIKDGGTTLLTNTLSSDINSLNGNYSSPITDLSNQTISSSLTFEIQNLSSDGSGGLVTINPSRRLVIDIYLRNVVVKSITLSGSENFSLADTSDFSISGNNVSAQSVSGVINTFVTNYFPLEFNLQVYFMDETKSTKLDSLFDSSAVILAGSASSPVESKFTASITESKINNLNNASYARTIFRLNYNGAPVTIQKDLTVSMRMVGDLKLQLNN
jgi:hypothetical protein